MSYNATAFKFDADGNSAGIEAVELNEDGVVIRACGHLIPGLTGKPAFEQAWRKGFFSFVADVKIVADNAEGYKNALSGLQLPPAYN
jgi:hypothetical protein